MVGLTIKQMKNWCDSAIKLGYEDRLILVAGDDEGNSYHALYKGFSIPSKDFFNGEFAPMLCADVAPNEAKEKTLILE